jgi:hypothetical protein
MLNIKDILFFCMAVAEWMVCSGRYRTEQVVVPGSMRPIYHEPSALRNGLFRLEVLLVIRMRRIVLIFMGRVWGFCYL